MTVKDLIVLSENRLVFLNQARSDAVRIGDVVRLEQIDQEIISTQITLDQLRTLV